MPSDDLSAATWRKSSHSNGQANCVEIAVIPTGEVAGDCVFAVRHSKVLHGPKLVFTRAEWEAFIDGAKEGEFDLPPSESGSAR